jgi:hypothetical protein
MVVKVLLKLESTTAFSSKLGNFSPTASILDSSGKRLVKMKNSERAPSRMRRTLLIVRTMLHVLTRKDARGGQRDSLLERSSKKEVASQPENRPSKENWPS